MDDMHSAVDKEKNNKLLVHNYSTHNGEISRTPMQTKLALLCIDSFRYFLGYVLRSNKV